MRPTDDSSGNACSGSNGGDLVDQILRLTGWTQARLAYELRITARLLQEPEPTGLSAVTVNRWRRGRQVPGAYYRRLLGILHGRVNAPLASIAVEAASDPHQTAAVHRERHSTTFRVLNGLARLLPAADRPRFVAETEGNLGDCDRWWQRVDHLVCLALGMPRLVWMMRRGGRRERV